MARHLRVLIIEDSRDDSELIALELQAAGYDPVMTRVQTPEELKNAFENGEWDLVISDYKLPHLTVPAALELYAAADLDVPFIIVSGTIGEDAAVEAMRLGAHDYFRKENLKRLGPAVDRELTAAQIRAQKRENVRLESFWARAATVLVATRDYGKTLVGLARLMVPEVADLCVVHIVDREGRLCLGAVACADESKRATVEEIERLYLGSLCTDGTLRSVLSSAPSAARAILTEDSLPSIARGEHHLALLRSLGMAARVSLPLRSPGDAVGVLTLATTRESRVKLRPAGLPFLEELGRRVAVILENARFFRDTQAAVRARDEFLSIASHELKTPLTALELQIGGVQQVARSQPQLAVSSDQVQSKLRLIARQVDRFTALINRLLDVARITSGRIELAPERFDLREALRSVLARMREAIQLSGSTIVVQAEVPVVGVWDRLRIESVISNLLTNAVKYGEGKPVEIAVGRVSEGAQLTVKDAGIGIPEQDQQRIFERFERAVSVRHYGGFGIGLWVVRQVVEAHGGSIRVHSQPRSGTTFTIDLPFEPPRSQP